MAGLTRPAPSAPDAGTTWPTPRHGRPPSIRRRTSCSRRRPAPARRGCSSSATSTCCAPASIPTTSSRSRSPARPPPRCGERIVERLRKPAARRSSTPRAGAICSDRLGDIAISTIDAFCLVAAPRVSARSRRRSRVSIWPTTRRSPRLIDESLDQALRICRAHRARGRRRGAGVRAARRAPSARGARGAARSAAGRAAGAAAVPAERARAI